MNSEETNPRRKVLWSIGVLLVLFYALIPVIWILSLSLKDPTTIGDQSFLPTKWTFDNYNSVFSGGLGFTHALINSIGIAMIATVIALALASMAAYAITRLEFPGKTLILAGALAISMFPAISIVGGLYNIWRQVGLYDTWPGLILPYLSFSLPISIYILSAFFREIPWDLEKAAQMDGATGMQAFRRVILPLAMPGVFTAGILTFIGAWNDFLFANVLTSTNAARTAPVALSYFRGASQFTDPSGAIAAGAVIVTIPILIMVLIFQRRIVSGLTAGAVKG
jgi:multiple sugar transport system permease protein